MYHWVILIVCIVMSVISVRSFIGALPQASRWRRAVALPVLMAGGVSLGILVGWPLGLFLHGSDKRAFGGAMDMLRDDDAFSGALGMGFAGLLAGLMRWAYVTMNDPARIAPEGELPMSRTSAVVLPGLSAIGVLVGLLVRLLDLGLDRTTREDMPFLLAVIGAAAGMLIVIPVELAAKRRKP